MTVNVHIVRQEIKSMLVMLLELDISPGEIGDEDPLFEGGALDSVIAVEIVAELEARFSIRVLDDDIDSELFRNVCTLAAMVQRRLP